MESRASFLSKDTACGIDTINLYSERGVNSLNGRPADSRVNDVQQGCPLRMFIHNQDGSTTDDEVTDSTTQEGFVHSATNTDKQKLPRCSFCIKRMSKLRKLERMQGRKQHLLTCVSPSTSTWAITPRSTLNQDRRDKSCQTSAALFERAHMTPREIHYFVKVMGQSRSIPLGAETFCKCVRLGRERDCTCGEDDKDFDWLWQTPAEGRGALVQENGRGVLFHKDYSCGTAAIQGARPMETDQYFWEVKLTTPVYGTDMMIGIGTPSVDLNKYHDAFCSMLGIDSESWGISYSGKVHHNGKKKEYCGRFGQGAIIGVHLDMWHGSLAFFRNRQNQGVAFRGLRGRSLHPMLCSTAARSSMRLVSSRTFPSSLQFLCCRRLRGLVPRHLSVLDTVPMPPGLRMFLRNNLAWLLGSPPQQLRRSSGGNNNKNYMCDICLPLKYVFEGYTCEELESSTEEEECDHIYNVYTTTDVDSQDDDSEDTGEEEVDEGERVQKNFTIKRKAGPSVEEHLPTPSLESAFSDGCFASKRARLEHSVMSSSSKDPQQSGTSAVVECNLESSKDTLVLQESAELADDEEESPEKSLHKRKKALKRPT